MSIPDHFHVGNPMQQAIINWHKVVTFQTRFRLITAKSHRYCNFSTALNSKANPPQSRFAKGEAFHPPPFERGARGDLQ
jgi:hypothetical protein